jgi:RHH-type transcriptional regulator, rel operon repressor / antitoxin RelB
LVQITAKVPDQLVRELDEAARRLDRSRAELVRFAVEYYLDDLEDLRLGLERLQDPSDAVLEWEEVRRGLLDPDQGER